MCNVIYTYISLSMFKNIIKIIILLFNHIKYHDKSYNFNKNQFMSYLEFNFYF